MHILTFSCLFKYICDWTEILLAPTSMSSSPCEITSPSSLPLLPSRPHPLPPTTTTNPHPTPTPPRLPRLPRQADAPCDGTPAWEDWVKPIRQHLICPTLFILRSNWRPWLPPKPIHPNTPPAPPPSNPYQALMERNTLRKTHSHGRKYRMRHSHSTDRRTVHKLSFKQQFNKADHS